MKYIEKEEKNKIDSSMLIIIVLSIICVILLGYIIVDKASTKEVNCEEICQDLNKEEPNEDKTTKPTEPSESENPPLIVEGITVDTSYKITPNLPNLDYQFAASSCITLKSILEENKINTKAPYSITIRDIALNNTTHKYRYVVDHKQNITIEVFDGEYIATKDNANYELTKVCNYDNYFIALESLADQDKISSIKIINTNGEIKYYEKSLIDISYENELLELTLIKENKYQVITLNLLENLTYEIIKEVECESLDSSNSSLTDEEKNILSYCELSKKS